MEPVSVKSRTTRWTQDTESLTLDGIFGTWDVKIFNQDPRNRNTEALFYFTRNSNNVSVTCTPLSHQWSII